MRRVTRLTRQSQADGSGQSCEYVRQRNALIKQAEEIADEVVPDIVSPGEDGGASHANWTTIFSAAMNRLSEPLLLNSANGSEPLPNQTEIPVSLISGERGSWRLIRDNPVVKLTQGSDSNTEIFAMLE